MDLDLLKRISISLGHNFVAEYADFVEQQIQNENENKNKNKKTEVFDHREQ